MNKNGNKKANHLINEKSPYLLQHAYNPVNWYPWSEEAFERAKNEDKPVFLSSGYSTCHWCHVMAHESFNDPEVAELLNRHFISIKVDREERPDIDDIYMQACRLMTGSGGWPLSVFMTADKKPFYIGTYFPKTGNYGRPGFLDLLKIINTSWQEDRQKILSSAGEITSALKQKPKSFSAEPDTAILDKTYQQMAESYDSKRGGFGSAPKFPMPHQIIFLLHYWQKTGQEQALAMAEKTLQAMRCGGIYDQLGYGFHRYSTDREWLLPHFEKMLYDQALHIYAFTEAYQATGKKLYARVIKEIAGYLQEKLLSPEGGFYSAEDADSEGVEGKYYLWTEEEIRDILPPTEVEEIIELYNIRSSGNFQPEAGVNNEKTNILHLTHTGSKINKVLAESKEARQLLYEKREERIKPALDDKILTDWNGLMIGALARAGWALDDDNLIKLATDAAGFVYQHLFEDSGKLLHRYREGEASFRANLDDYSFLIRGMIELYQATFEPDYLQKALTLTRQMIFQFEDQENGGFYFTPEGGEKLIARQKKIEDGALPSGNSMAIWNLFQLAQLTGKKELQEKAETIAATFFPQVENSPSYYSQYIIGLTAISGSHSQLVITGRRDDPLTGEFFAGLRTIYQPQLAVIFKPVENPDKITEIAPFTSDHKMINDRTTAYVCKNFSCQQPTNDPEKMKALSV